VKVAWLQLFVLALACSPIGVLYAAAPDTRLQEAQRELDIARRLSLQEEARFEAALQACETTFASSRCSESEVARHRKNAPILQQKLHTASQKVRDVRAFERSLGQAKRIDSRAAREARQAAPERSVVRQRGKAARAQSEQSVEAIAKRARSVQRYEAKLARHQAKIARSNAKKKKGSGAL
jgi:hypothetical protein